MGVQDQPDCGGLERRPNSRWRRGRNRHSNGWRRRFARGQAVPPQVPLAALYAHGSLGLSVVVRCGVSDGPGSDQAACAVDRRTIPLAQGEAAAPRSAQESTARARACWPISLAVPSRQERVHLLGVSLDVPGVPGSSRDRAWIAATRPFPRSPDPLRAHGRHRG
jgi:hypothetical protein